MHGRKDLVRGLVAGLVVLLGIAIAIPVNVVTNYLPATVTGHRVVWIGLLAGAALVVMVLTWLSGRMAEEVPGERLSMVPQVAGWVDRAELADVVSALTTASSGTVALTTGLVGAGGFGKTSLATRACHDPVVRRRFRGGIVWVTVGRDVNGPGLVARLNEVIANVGGDASTFTSPEQAGYALARALRQRGQTLLVVDDVWTAGQLEPFTAAGRSCRLLVTTRRPVVLAGVAARRIHVDAMPDAVARRLLMRELPALATGRERELLELTGRWPLLLSLVNHRLAEEVRRGAGIDAAAADAAARLRRGGPAALDITDSGKRQTAVAATIDYSLEALDVADRDRFCELGIFAEDAEVPLAIVALLWQGTAGLSTAASEWLCERLDGLSLLTLTWAGDMRVMVVHDVIRDFAVSRISSSRLAAAHAALIGAARRAMGPAEAGETVRCDDHDKGGGTAWWRLPETTESGYLWQNLTYHLQAAGLETELDRVCCDLRFLTMRLQRAGPAAVEADLAHSASDTAGRLRRAVAQNSRLLGPIEPAAALITTLTSCLGGIPEMADQLPALRSCLHAWTAWPVWPPPDRPDTPIRALSGHGGRVDAVAISPDGTWLATAMDGAVEIWAADGTHRATLTGHGGRVDAVAISPDGTWLATAMDGAVEIWAADGTHRATLTGHGGWVYAVAISPDGTWLATGGTDRTVRIWAADGTRRAIIDRPIHGPLHAVAISPDGTWLAAASDGTVRIWAADGTYRATLDWNRTSLDSYRGADAVAISPDGTWLATGAMDGAVEIWAADGTHRATLIRHGDRVHAVAISPDGTWLATISDGRVRIWSTKGTSNALATAIRVDGTVRDCAWFPGSTDLCITGQKGLYRFSLRPPDL